MDVTNVQSVMDRESLSDAFDFLIEVGEIPYRANRRALVELGLNRNTVKGLKKVQEAIDGITGLIGELELFRDASQEIADTAIAALRSA